MYRLVAFDLDGTLLNDRKKILKENLKIIEFLRRKGVDFIIATGRGYISAKNLIPEKQRDMTAICNNGSVIRKMKDDRLISENIIDGRIVKNILEEAENFDLDPLIHINEFEDGYDVLIRNDNIRFAKENRNLKSVLRYKEIESYSLENLNRVLALAFFGEEEKVLSFFNSVNDKYGDEYNSHIMENISNGEALAEFMSLKSDKWYALKDYAYSRSIREDEIIVFGDDNNDMDMIKNAGLGIAMKNANKSVKQFADIVTDEDNNGPAIYKELKRIFKI